ncbi:MAG: co-chaperone DjlA [Proteobacteria bacterium]|nr:co-chaperone DjlA [Pseudomonadota bacterium]
MRWNGKIVGLIIGLLSGHPLGVLLGVVIGHLFDTDFFQKWLGKGQINHTSQTQHIFFDATFSVMGYLAKADGRVTESEIKAAEQVMQDMGLDAGMRREAIRLFNQGKQPDFDLTATMIQLKSSCWAHPNLLRTFLEIQTQIAYAEGGISQGKRTALRAICQELGVQGFIFDQFEQQAHAQQNYQQTRPDPAAHLANSYQILNVSSNASDAEVKKAYRRLLGQNHPDKLMSQGLPPEMIKLANERTQKIKSAYETIKKARGMS